MRYIVVPPSRNGSMWWLVVYTDEHLIEGATVAKLSQDYVPQSEMWAKLLCDQLNRGAK
jgi:hypothetical protein